MMCFGLTLLGLAGLGLLVVAWIALRILVLSRDFHTIGDLEDRRGRGANGAG